MSAEVVPFPFLSRLNISNIDDILHRDLIASHNEHRALVSYGFKQGAQTHYIGTKEALENNWTIDFVEGLALDALAKHTEPEWEPKVVTYEGKEHTLLIREGDDLTASSILRKQLLKEIQAHFGTPSVGFAVPNRNTIIAGGKPEAIVEFLNEVYHNSSSKGYETVSNMVYLVRNGNVLAAAPMPDNMRAPMTKDTVSSLQILNSNKSTKVNQLINTSKGKAPSKPKLKAGNSSKSAAASGVKKMRKPGASTGKKKISIKKKR